MDDERKNELSPEEKRRQIERVIRHEQDEQAQAYRQAGFPLGYTRRGLEWWVRGGARSTVN